MLKSREYIGLSLEGTSLKIARVKPVKDGLQIIRLEKLSLVSAIKNKIESEKEQGDTTSDVFDEAEDSDSIFGLDDELENSDLDDELETIDLSSMDDDDMASEETLDLAEEAAQPTSNEEMLVHYLDDLEKKKIILGLNIPAGNAIFQILRDTDYSKVKTKEIDEVIQIKLDSIYGRYLSRDYYDYSVRKDGALVLTSIDDESPTLKLVRSTKERFNTNYYISDVVPDEVSMIGLYRDHYQPEEGNITGLIQFGPDRTRMIFMQGSQILSVSPIINEGTNQKGFLNTIFSKILFQLDSGEIPALDRIVICNSTIGDKAIKFFKNNFRDLPVENFTFNREKLLYEESLEEIVPGFTTVIGIAAATANFGKSAYPEISFLPAYISDQQKVFKLHWHGFLLLILIGASPVILNHFYQKNVNEASLLQSQKENIETQIRDIQPLIIESEELSYNLAEIQSQLDLLTELSKDNIRWTVTLDEFNRAVGQVGGLWINSFRQNNDVIMVTGYSMNRERIPELANRFPEVTLLSVRREQVLDTDIFYFNMMIRKIVADESRLTPRSVANE